MHWDWNVVQAVTLTLVSVAGVVIALVGLSTWRRQLKGTYDFELSRRILLSIYQIREAIALVRHPFLQPGEASEGEDDWEASAYENRWSTLSKARSELSVAALEAEVAWRDPLKEEQVALNKLISRLLVALRHYLESTRKAARHDVFGQADEEVLWAMDDDDFSQQVGKVVSDIEGKVRPHLSGARTRTKRKA